MSSYQVTASTSVVQLLTCFLALCSALIFILLYLRPQWTPHTPARPQRRSSPSSSSTHRQRRPHSSSHRPTALALSPTPSPSRRSFTSRFASSSPRSPSSPHPSVLIPIPVPFPTPPKPKPSTSTTRRSSSPAYSSFTVHPVSSSPSHPTPLSPPLLAYPVIISLTTLSSRLPHILPCLASLHAQTYPIHRILLHLSPTPHSSPSYPPTPPPIPPQLACLPWLTLLPSPHDHGPLTRLLSLPPHLPSPHYLLTVDDDVIYHPHMLATLAAASYHLGDTTAVGHAGYKLRGAPWVRGNVEYACRGEEGGAVDAATWEEEEGGDSSPLLSPSSPPSPSAGGVASEAVDVLQSWRGVLYPPSTLPHPPSLLLDVLRTFPASVRWMDDEFVSAWQASQGVGRRVVVAMGVGEVGGLDGGEGGGEGVVVGRLRLKEGRWGGGGVAGVVRMERRWEEGMEALVARGWWGRGWEVDDASTGGKGGEGGGVGGGRDGRRWEEEFESRGRDVRDLIVEEDGVGEEGEAVVLGTKGERQGESSAAGLRDERKEELEEPVMKCGSAVKLKGLHSR